MFSHDMSSLQLINSVAAAVVWKMGQVKVQLLDNTDTASKSDMQTLSN